MERAQLIKKIRQLELKAKGLSNQLFSGEYHSAFKGTGMAFSEVREYHPGDEVRTIDWNVTARTNTPHIKVFQEERELTVLLLIDVSGSQHYGSEAQTKLDLATEIAASLTFSAINNNDKVGAIFFSDHVEKYIPPDKGKKHALRILGELCTSRKRDSGTDIEGSINFMLRTQKKRSICFVISDFLTDHNLNEPLRQLSKKHDTIAVQLKDHSEFQFPDFGFVRMFHAESGVTRWYNAFHKKNRQTIIEKFQHQETQFREQLTKLGIELVTCETGMDFRQVFIQLFRQRK